MSTPKKGARYTVRNTVYEITSVKADVIKSKSIDGRIHATWALWAFPYMDRLK